MLILEVWSLSIDYLISIWTTRWRNLNKFVWSEQYKFCAFQKENIPRNPTSIKDSCKTEQFLRKYKFDYITLLPRGRHIYRVGPTDFFLKFDKTTSPSGVRPCRRPTHLGVHSVQMANEWPTFAIFSGRTYCSKRYVSPLFLKHCGIGHLKKLDCSLIWNFHRMYHSIHSLNCVNFMKK